MMMSSKLLNRITPTIHRCAVRGGGIRWSSYVGDVRCSGSRTSSSSSSSSTTTTTAKPLSTTHFFFHNDRQRQRQHHHNNSININNTNIINTNNTRYISINTGTSIRSQSPSRALSTSASAAAPHERLLILGSGVAGCAAALTAARHGVPVTVLHAGSEREDCNSYWAQGGVIYRNYRLRKDDDDYGGGKNNNGGRESELVDTPLSLVNDIRIASGYTSPLQRSDPLEECTYTSDLIQNSTTSSKMGQVCPKSGVNWNEDAAWKLACEGPSRIRQLLLGSKDDGQGDSPNGCVVPFDRTALPVSGEDDDNDALNEKDGSEDDVLSLCLEASHAAPRIIHHADCTGKAITVSITKAASEHPLIEFVGDSVVTDLIMDEDGGESSSSSGINGANDNGMVIGAQVLNKRTNQRTNFYAVHGVVLASGGLAGIYQHSTNPLGFNALGSSVGLALRLDDRLAGSGGGGSMSDNNNHTNTSGIVSDLEYVQFHPTSLYLPNEARFLLTEALRGEGAILRDADGRAFAKDYHPNGELAPRDIVARAVFSESQKASGDQHNAYLDITHRDCTWLKDRFPSIHVHLQSRDVPMDFTKENIPVTPAAHYTCGGVTTDMNGCVIGSSSGSGGAGWYRNLYAAGEAARTGLHGGNRLASTSLLEGLVFGASVGEMVAGVIPGSDSNGENAVIDEAALEAREKVTETMHHARHAIEHRLVMEQTTGSSNGQNTPPADEKISQEATAILTHMKALMWDNVGVVRTPSKLAEAVSEMAAIRDQANQLWKEDGAGWEVAALRDAAHSGLAVADAALANRVSGGAHFVQLEEEMEQGGSNGEAKAEQDSDDDDDLVAARA